MKKNKITQIKKNSARAESTLKLLANSKRLMILCHLLKERKSVSDLLRLIDLSQSALSQHLAKMRNQGIVSCHKEGQMVYYQIANFEIEAILTTLYLIYCK